MAHVRHSSACFPSALVPADRENTFPLPRSTVIPCGALLESWTPFTAMIYISISVLWYMLLCRHPRLDPQLRTWLCKNDNVKTFITMLMFCCRSRKLWEGSDHTSDDLVKIPKASITRIPSRNGSATFRIHCLLTSTCHVTASNMKRGWADTEYII